MLDYGDVCLSLHLKALIQCITVRCTSSQVINELTHHLVLHEEVGWSYLTNRMESHCTLWTYTDPLE